MPPSSRGNAGSSQGSGGLLPILRRGVGGRASHRRGPGHFGGGGGGGGGGGIGRRWGRPALAGSALLLVAVLTTRPWRQAGTLPGNTGVSTPGFGGNSRFVGEGLTGDGIALGPQGETAAEGGVGTGDAEALSLEEGSGGAEESDDKWGADPDLGPGAPGFPLGEDDLHVAFSTDCTNYQAWQAVVLFHSAIVSGHKGPITQLISGCTEEEKQAIIDRHERVRHTPKHRLFFSPSFVINHPQTGEPYPYMNKPNVMQLWFNATKIDETIVALIDPDFIFLKPLTTRMNPEEIVARGDGLSLEGLNLENGGWVRKGYPAGQRFGLPNWTHWDRTKFCPEDSLCATAAASTAKRYFDLIPPYLAHQDDWRRLLPEWVVQAPKVYDIYPSLLAEQTAYSTAAATLNLKHYRLSHFAVENEKADYERWDAVDHHMDNVCDISIEPGDSASRDLRSFDRMPHFIHYCQMYRVGQWLFNKRRFRKDHGYDQLECSTPLLVTPPMDMQENTFKMHPGARYEQITARSAKRNAFVLCTATRFINSAFRHFKGRMCADDHLNLNQTVRIA